MTEDMTIIAEEAYSAAREILEKAKPEAGELFVVGCSTSEMDPVHIFPINRDKENAVISRLFSMFSINLVQAKSSKNKGF